MNEGRAFSVTADGLTYAGLEWGDPDGYPILALHGWLDNALSFSVIAPFLSEYRLIALDVSGQGLSYHRSPDATYHIWALRARPRGSGQCRSNVAPPRVRQVTPSVE